METPEGIQMRDFATDPVPESKADPTPDTIVKPTSFWSRWIRVIIDEEACRDHFALERTFLAYVRTASAYAQFGVTLSQLFRLHNDSSNSGNSGNSSKNEKGLVTTALKVGNALGAATECIAILIMLIGATYFFKKQSGLLKGVFTLTGWDTGIMMVCSVLLMCAIFGLLVAAGRY